MNEKSTKKQNPLFMILTALLALSTLILAGALMMTKGQVEEAQQNISSLESTVSQQKEALSAYESEHWSPEQRQEAIAVAAATLNSYLNSRGTDSDAWKYNLGRLGTDKFKAEVNKSYEGLKFNGSVGWVEEADFSQPDKAVITVTSTTFTRDRNSYYPFEFTILKDGKTLKVDEMEGKEQKITYGQ